MKRENHLFEIIVSEENTRKSIKDVCDSHRWCHYPDKPNKTVIWIENTIDERVKELQNIIMNGFESSPVIEKTKYDHNAKKWRKICEPRLWPDQCVHHALIQVLQPVMMRGMDYWCCGSIKGRGAHYGIKGIKKWVRMKRGAKWCVELDIRHFYDSLKPEQVINRMRSLIKDYRTLDLIERITKDGIKIGFYTSQWFANTFLQPLDAELRKLGVSHYIRYMDNITIFSNRKKIIDKAIKLVRKWLEERGLELKDNWQKFEVSKRMVNALGYRFNRNCTLIRKHTLLRLKRTLKKYYKMVKQKRPIPVKFAQGLLSRLGMLKHCNCVSLRKRLIKKKTMKALKNIVREYYRKETAKWNTYLQNAA